MGPLRFDPERELSELREYLGDSYDHSLLQRSTQAVEQEFAATGNEDRFYRSSRGYLYDLTVFAMSGTKLPYLEEIVRRCPTESRLLDYGCGIGSDGLMLLEAGYRVEFADFDNPSTSYLRWRLRERGLEAPLHDLDRGVPEGFDLAFAFDVIEHLLDPVALLDQLEPRASLVLINLLAPERDDTELHNDLPIADLMRRIARRRLVSYSLLHGRSHLVLYSPAAAGPLRAAANRARLGAGRVRWAMARLWRRLIARARWAFSRRRRG